MASKSERQNHLHFLECMDRINRAIQGTNDLDAMMHDVLAEVLSIFDCDRSSLVYPCDPESSTWTVPMECTRSEYPGVFALGIDIPSQPETVALCQLVLDNDGPVRIGSGSEHPLPVQLTEQFNIQSQIAMSVHPKRDKPWIFFLTQCSRPRVWSDEESRLLQEIGRRLADGLTSLLVMRELQESEAKYRRFVETSSEGVWALDQNCLTTFVNARMTEMLGYGSDEVIGHPLSNFMFEDDVADHEYQMTRRRQGVSEQYERRLRCKDGGEVWAQVSASAIIGEDGNFQGSFAMLTDISERKRAEEALEREKTLTSRIMVTSPVGIVTISREGLITFANPQAEKILGLCEDKITQLSYNAPEWHSTTVDGAPFPEEELPFSRVLASRQPVFDVQHAITWPDGRRVLLSVNGAPIFDAQDEIEAVTLSIDDITKRKFAEDKLRRSESDLIEAQRIAKLGSWYLDLATNEVVWSEELYRMCGYDPKLPPPNYDESSQLYTEKGWDLLTSAMTQTVEKGIPYEIELEMVQKEGKNKWIWARGELQRNADGNPVMVHGVALDITERKQAEQAALQNEEALKEAQRIANMGSWHLDLVTNDVVMSEELYRIYGIDPTQPAPNFEESASLFKTESWERLTSEITQLLDTGTPYVIELEMAPKDGSKKWIQARGELVRDAKGNPVTLRGIAMDITERRYAEEELRRSESDLIEAQRIAHMGSWHMNLENNEVVWSEELYRMCDYDPTLPPPAYDVSSQLYTADSWNRLTSAMSQTVEKGTPYEIELEMVQKEGNNKWIWARGELVRDATGKPVIVHGVALDITERKHSEQQLSLLNFALNNLRDEAILMDAQAQISYVNDMACRTLKYTREKLLTMAIPDIDPLHTPERWPETWANIQKSGSLTFESLRQASDGSQYPVEVSATHFSFGDQGYIFSLSHDITERKQVEMELHRLNRELKAISNCNQALLKASDEQELLNEICGIICEQAGYLLAWVGYAQNDKDKTVKPVAWAGNGSDYVANAKLSWSEDLEHGRGPAGIVIRSGETIYVEDIEESALMTPWRQIALQHGYHSGIFMPLKDGNHQPFGALLIYASEKNAINRDEIRLLEELAGDMAYGITSLRTHQEHSQTVKRLRESLVATIGAVALMAEKRDPYTAGHQKKVAQLCEAIGEELGLDEDRLEGLRLGAMIHDIGKISVPAEILSHPGKISDLELAFIKQHPQIGYEIVKDIKFLWPVAEMVHQHHERMDGSGYPLGLEGSAILLESRIIAVADVVEAMMSHRPYRPGLGLDQALQEIETNRGTKYDSAVVDICLKLFRDRGFSLEE